MKVEQGATLELKDLNEDLEVGDGSRIVSLSDSGFSVISGNVKCSGRVEFDGNFQCGDFSGNHCRVTIDALRCDDLGMDDGELLVSGA